MRNCIILYRKKDMWRVGSNSTSLQFHRLWLLSMEACPLMTHNCAIWENILLVSPDTLESTESPEVVLGLSAWTLHTANSILPLSYHAGHMRYAKEGRYCTNPLLDSLTELHLIRVKSWKEWQDISPSQGPTRIPAPLLLLFLPSFPLSLDKWTQTDHLFS